MIYFLFGLAFIALHTISILLVNRISLTKRLFLVVWVMLFVVGAPTLFRYISRPAFAGVCVLGISLYLLLLFSQELTPAGRRAGSSRSRKKRRSSSRRRRADEEPDQALTEDLNFAAASLGKRKENRRGPSFDEMPVALATAGAGALADDRAQDDMTGYDKPQPFYTVDNLAVEPSFEDEEHSGGSQLDTAGEGSSAAANDEFLGALLDMRHGSTKIKVANSMLRDSDQDPAAEGFTDIDDPAFETAVLAKIRPLTYAESEYGGRPASGRDLSAAADPADEGEDFSSLTEVQDEAAAPAFEAVSEEPASSLEDFFYGSEADQEFSERSAAEAAPAATEPQGGLESLFFAEAEEAAAETDPAAEAFAAEPAEADQTPAAADLEETQELYGVLNQLQFDLLGPADQVPVSEVDIEPAAETAVAADSEESAAAELQPVSMELEEAPAQPAADSSEADLLKEIAEILKAEEAAEAAKPAPAAADETESSEADLLSQIAGILQAEEAAEATSTPARPAESAAPAEDREVYYQFLLLESQELAASGAYQEAEDYVKEIITGSSDRDIRRQALDLLDKIEKM